MKAGNLSLLIWRAFRVTPKAGDLNLEGTLLTNICISRKCQFRTWMSFFVTDWFPEALKTGSLRAVSMLVMFVVSAGSSQGVCPGSAFHLLPQLGLGLGLGLDPRTLVGIAHFHGFPAVPAPHHQVCWRLFVCCYSKGEKDQKMTVFMEGH